MEFLADLVDQVDVHLMIEEGIHLQNIARKQLSVFANTLFKQNHNGSTAFRVF